MSQRYKLWVVGRLLNPTNSVKALTGNRAKVILSLFLPHLSIVQTAARYAVSTWTLIVVAYHIYCNQEYKPGSVTTTTSPMKPRHTAEANDSPTELFPEREGERLVPVPVLEMGCEVGLHGGKLVIDPKLRGAN